MSTSLIARYAGGFLFGAYALLVLVPRFFPRAAISRWLTRTRILGRRERSADLSVAAAYHVQLPAERRAGELDDRTWQDLDLDEVFRSLDFGACEPGRQYVYHMIQSVSAWRANIPRWAQPEFTETRKTLHAEALRHPLVEKPVPNSLAVSDRGVIITGSNMSGKTIFVRTSGQRHRRQELLLGGGRVGACAGTRDRRPSAAPLPTR